MVREAHGRGRTDIKPAHNHLFGILGLDGDRSANLAARAGITRQAMGEVIRDLVDLGILEMVPDPQDKRAKIVRYTDEGRAFASAGYRHLADLEDRFAEEFGVEGYEAVRAAMQRITEILAELDADAE
jgi:DNA-binding MarR family transcriptional regulator